MMPLLSKPLPKIFFIFLSVMCFSAVAMDDGLGNKRSPDQELTERALKRHQSGEQDDVELLTLTDEQFKLVEELFEMSYRWSLASYRQTYQKIVAMNFGRGNELVQSINEKVRVIQESEDPTVYLRSDLIQRKMKAQIKSVINEAIEELFEQKLLTEKQRLRLSVITLDDEPIQLGQRIDSQDEVSKEHLLRCLFEGLVSIGKHCRTPNHRIAFVLGHSLFPTIVHDIQRQFDSDYSVPHKRIAGKIIQVADQLQIRKVVFTYEQMLYPLLFELLYTEFTRNPQKKIHIPETLFGDGRFPYAYLWYLLDGHGIGEITLGEGLIPLIPSLLSARSLLKEELSLQDLTMIWERLSLNESLRDNNGINCVLTQKTEDELTEGFNLLAKALLCRNGNLAKCLVRSLCYPGVTLSVMTVFNYGVPLDTYLIHTAVRGPIEDDRRGEDLHTVKELMRGFAKTMKAMVRYSSVRPEVPKLSEYHTSRNRVREVLLVFKRYSPRMLKDVKALIFSRDPELAQDVLKVFLTTSNRDQYDITDPFAYLRPVIHQKLLVGEAVVDLLKYYKVKRLKELLLVENGKGETPLAYYGKVVNNWKSEFGERLEGLEAVSLSLLNPDKLEENFGEDIEESIRSKLKPASVEVLERIKL